MDIHLDFCHRFRMVFFRQIRHRQSQGLGKDDHFESVHKHVRKLIRFLDNQGLVREAPEQSLVEAATPGEVWDSYCRCVHCDFRKRTDSAEMGYDLKTRS